MWHKLLLIHNLEGEMKTKHLIYRHTFETSRFLWLRAKNVSLCINAASGHRLSNEVFHTLEASQDSGSAPKHATTAAARRSRGLDVNRPDMTVDFPVIAAKT